MGDRNVEDFTINLAYFLGISEAAVKALMFYWNRSKFRNLFRKIEEILDSGTSFDEKTLDEIRGKSLRFLWTHLGLSHSASFIWVLGALFRVFYWNERVLPFKGT